MASSPFLQQPSRPEGVFRVRREPRTEAVRIVDYAPFPRAVGDGGSRIGFTRDYSRSGMCIGVDDRQQVGDLLRVTLRDVDGRPARSAIERVVWCRAERDGRFFVGLELVAEAEAARPA